MAFLPGPKLWLTAVHRIPARRPRTCARRRAAPFAKAAPDDFAEDFADPDLHSSSGRQRSSFPANPSSSEDGPTYPSANGAATSQADDELPTAAPSELDGTSSPAGGPAQDSGEQVDGADVAEDACKGAFMWSPSLQEYREQREAGLIASALEGRRGEYSDAWALSVSARKSHELKNQYSRVGILMERNFGDFEVVRGCEEEMARASLDEIALEKAKAVYHATGLPAIAETNDLSIDAPESGSRINKTLQQGYYTRNVDLDADAMIDRVRPISDESRMTRFSSAVAYVDGEIEVVTGQTVQVAILYSGQKYATIASTAALDDLYKTLTRRLGLTLENPSGAKASGEGDAQGKKGKALVGATLLKERILRDGKMLNDSIVKVSSFLNHMVDVDLMEVCGEELAERLRHCMPNKVLTVESTGLIVGLPTARKLGIPLVFARKTRPITISDSYQTSYRSATKGTTNELLVSCEYLEAGDRVLIVDDFLAGGSTAEALFKLAKMAHAKVVGVGVLIEKMSDGGRTFLSGYDVPVESLAKMLPGGEKGRISFVEEAPWVSPMVPPDERQKVREEALQASADYFTRAAATATGLAESAAAAARAAASVRLGREEEEDNAAAVGWEKGDTEVDAARRGVRQAVSPEMEEAAQEVAQEVAQLEGDEGSEGVGVMEWDDEEGEEGDDVDGFDEIEDSLIRGLGR